MNAGNKKSVWIRAVDVLNYPLESINTGSKCDITTIVDGPSNDNKLYIWSSFARSLNYQNIPEDSYEEFLWSSTAKNLNEKLERNSHLEALYLIALKNDDVGAVGLDGWLYSQLSSLEAEDMFTGLIMKHDSDLESKGFDNDKFIYSGIKFLLNEFTLSSNNLPEKSYTPLLEESGDSYTGTNLFVGSLAFLTNNTHIEGGEFERNLLVWNNETGEISKIENDFRIGSLKKQGHNLLAIGWGEDSALGLQTLSIKPTVESLNVRYYPGKTPIDNKSTLFNFKKLNYGALSAIPVNRLNQFREVVRYDNSDGYSGSVIDFLFFRVASWLKLVNLTTH